MNIKPILNNVYYVWEDIEKKIGHIVIPAGAAIAVRKAIVRAVGPTCEIVKVGDKVLTSKYTGVHLFLCMEDVWTDGERHRMCREDEFISMYSDTEEESKEIDKWHKKTRDEFLKGKAKELGE